MSKRHVDLFEGARLGASRASRFFQSPVRNLAIAYKRRFGPPTERLIHLAWGGVFAGVIPEAVSSLIWRHGWYEPETSLLVAQELPLGGTFVDIGAHFGYFSLLASDIVSPSGCVVAVEPMPETFAKLTKNIGLNNSENIKALNIALSDTEGDLTFQDFGLVLSSLNTSVRARGVLDGKSVSARDVHVKARTGDSVIEELNLARVDIIKIDAESSEDMVLRGLERTLRKYRPVVLVELGGSGHEDVRDAKIGEFMGGLDYEGFCKTKHGEQTISEFSGLSYMNVVFRPR